MDELLKKIEIVQAETGMTLWEMAHKFSISYSAMSGWIRQGVRPPSWQVPMLMHYIDYCCAGGQPAEPPVGENPVRYLISITGLSQRGFARELGISRRTIGDWCTEANRFREWLYPPLYEWLVYNQLIKLN